MEENNWNLGVQAQMAFVDNEELENRNHTTTENE